MTLQENMISDLKPDQINRLVVRVDNRARIDWLPAAEQIEKTMIFIIAFNSTTR